MNELNGSDFLKLLKSIDIDLVELTGKSFDWIFDNPETRPLLNWLCTYVNENNVEHCLEAYDYGQLLEEGKVLTGAQLDERIAELNETHSGILDVRSSEIDELQMQINSALKNEKALLNLTSHTLDLDHKLNHEISKYSEEEIESKVYLQKAKDDLTECGLLIDTIHEEIYTTVESFINLLIQFSNPTTNKYFLSQIPLECYKQHFDNFNTYLNLWMKKELETEIIIKTIKKHRINDESSDSFVDSLNQELQRLNTCIEHSIVKRLKVECEKEELRTRLEYVNNANNMLLSDEEYRIKSIQVTSRINSLSEEFNRLCVTELEQSAQQLTESLINDVLLSYVQLKFKSNTEMLKKYRFLNQTVMNSASQLLLFSMIFKLEKGNVESFNLLLTETDLYTNKYKQYQYLCSQDYKKLENRYQIMKSLPLEQKNPFLKQMISLMIGNDDNEAEFTLRNAILERQKHKMSIANLTNGIFTTKNQIFWNDVKKIEKKISELKQFIWCGSSAEPIYIPYPYFEKSYNIKLHLDKISKKLSHSMNIYKQAESKLHKEKWFQEKRLLWVSFLMEPKQVLSIIKKLEVYVINQNRKVPVQDVEQFTFIAN